MERNVELKQIDFKNRTCYQFGGIIKIDVLTWVTF